MMKLIRWIKKRQEQGIINPFHKSYLKIAGRGIVDRFHKLYFESRYTKGLRLYWLGIPTMQYPTDLLIYQEIVHEIKPDIIIETGTSQGGCALFLASMCDLVKRGKVITIDIRSLKGRPKHRRITYLTGSSVSLQVVNKLKKMVKNKDKVMVLLDSAHNKEHVLEELQIYSKLVTYGSYLIVEDTKLNGHPVYSHTEPGAGPMEAVKEFLKETDEFVVDKQRERFYLTAHPSGFLKRIK